MDAALSRGGTYGAVVAVCRDQHGLFLGASVVGFWQINDPQTLESLSIREALALAEDLYVQSIHVGSDCKTVV